MTPGMRGIVRLWLGVLLLALAGRAFPAALEVRSDQQRLSLEPMLEYRFEDEQGRDGSWRPLPDNGMNFGFQAKTLALRFSLTNSGDAVVNRFLVIENPTLDHLELELLHQASGQREQLSLGDALPFSERLVDSRQFVVPLRIHPDDDLDIVLRVRESGSMQVPMALWQPDAWYRDTLYRQTALAGYFGLVFCLILYNLCLWLSSRMRAYSYYVLYIVSMGIVQASQTGFGAQFLWPNQPWFSYYAVSLFVNLSLLFAGLFSIQTLGLKKSQRSWWPPAVMVVVALAMLPAAFVIPESLHLRASVILGVLGSTAFLLVGLAQWRHGTVTARIYALAWVFLFVGAAVYGAAKLDWLPLNAFTDHVFLIGSAVEGVLLSFSLAARLREIGEQQQAMMQLRMDAEVERVRLQGEADSARTANETKSRFLATIGHEIRTPINGILGATELMSDMDMPAEQREYLDIVLHSGQVLLALVNNVLDYSRLEAGQLDVHLEPMNLPRLLASTRAIFASRYLGKALSMETELDPALPDWIVADEIRVRQVLINLIGNAFKFTHRGGVYLTVTGEGDWLRFAVRDTGEGMGEQLQESLFRAIVPASTGRGSERGAGLGLWICRQLVELMDGDIGLQSQPGQGTTVWFRVPLRLAKAPLKKPGQADDMVAAAKALSLLEDQAVLVVDDNAVNRMLLEQQLGHYGARVTVAEDGNQALAVFRELHFDLVLLDYDMPGMNGCEVASQMRGWEQKNGRAATRIIGISAYTLPEWQQAMVEAGMDMSISKPVNREGLLRAIRGE